MSLPAHILPIVFLLLSSTATVVSAAEKQMPVDPLDRQKTDMPPDPLDRGQKAKMPIDPYDREKKAGMPVDPYDKGHETEIPAATGR